MRLMITTIGDLYSVYGGGEVYVRNLVEALLEAGHKVKVIGDREEIGNAIRQEMPDLVHAHGRKSVAARAAMEFNVPYCFPDMLT